MSKYLKFIHTELGVIILTEDDILKFSSVENAETIRDIIIEKFGEDVLKNGKKIKDDPDAIEQYLEKIMMLPTEAEAAKPLGAAAAAR